MFKAAAAAALNPMEALSSRVCKDLGIVDTIFEEDSEDPSATPVSPLLPQSPTPLRSLVESWSMASGDEIDVVIHVLDSCYYLHKAPLRAKSGYMKLKLKDESELTISPPLAITPETFTLVTEFCYGTHLDITPFNLAPLRIAAELLEMSSEATGASEGSLWQMTEAYFWRAVAVNQDYATIVLRSCVSLLPEAETTAHLVSRCIEALMLMHDGDEAGTMTGLNNVLNLPPDDFQAVMESMNQSLANHDILYRIIDLYLKGFVGNITEEEKIQMCNYIDCTILSSEVLMHAAQNPRMPLRFVVQAMFVEQLNTRSSIVSAADGKQISRHQNEVENPTTLGANLQRDAALKQVAQLKAAMSTTNSRIQSLEKELSGMRRSLQESENADHQNTLDSGRSWSSRFSSENKVERGQIGSVSAGSFLSVRNNKDIRAAVSSSSDHESCDPSPPAAAGKKLGRRFIDGLKSAFRVSNLVPKKKLESNVASKVGGDGKINSTGKT